MELTVNTSDSYKIIIERNCIKQIGTYAKNLFNKDSKAFIVSDTNVLPIYGKTIVNSLKAAGFCVYEYAFPAGEESKRLNTIEKMYFNLSENGFTRSDFIVALGGGVAGDMAGFAAATYLRGIKFIQIPTSLLAQIDSSVGGKTAVDLPQGKNLVGSFHQPSLVLIDPNTLSTLPPHYFSDGMGEAIKYGCIKSRKLFDMILNTDIKENIEKLIYRCIDIKRGVVERDEFDNGERMLLNFGHTFGHSLEKNYNFKKLSHGEAVGIGMVMMAKCGEKSGITKEGTSIEIQKALKKYNLPIWDDMDIDKIVEATSLDKKNRGRNINLIMLKEIGNSFIYEVNKDGLCKLIEVLK